jgi:hypothetical protein
MGANIWVISTRYLSKKGAEKCDPVTFPFLCVRGGSLLGLRDNAKIRLRSLPPLGIEPFGFVV